MSRLFIGLCGRVYIFSFSVIVGKDEDCTLGSVAILLVEMVAGVVGSTLGGGVGGVKAIGTPDGEVVGMGVESVIDCIRFRLVPSSSKSFLVGLSTCKDGIAVDGGWVRIVTTSSATWRR